MLDGLVAHIYCSDFSQSTLFYNAVTSVAKIIKTNQAKIEEAARDFEQSLVLYLSAYFKDVQLSVRPIQSDDSVLNGELAINGEVTDHDGVTYTLRAALTRKGSIGKTVMDYLDNGVLK
jgi:hypothetical protein